MDRVPGRFRPVLFCGDTIVLALEFERRLPAPRLRLLDVCALLIRPKRPSIGPHRRPAPIKSCDCASASRFLGRRPPTSLSRESLVTSGASLQNCKLDPAHDDAYVRMQEDALFCFLLLEASNASEDKKVGERFNAQTVLSD